jgi:membrane protein DedA with SNARE-associated domain
MEAQRFGMGTVSEKERRAEREAAIRRGLILAVVIAAIILIGRFTPFAPVQTFFGGFTWFTKQAVDIVSDLFVDYGYWVAFFGPLLENTLFIGAIIPGTLVMLFSGIAAENGLISFFPAVLLSIAGAIIGDTISYGIGRFGWQRFGPESRVGRWAEQMREPLLHHSLWLILSYHFAGYSRLVGPAAAGFLRMPLLRWMMLDYLGVVLWVFSFVTGGYVLAAVLGLDLADASDSDRNVQVFEIILFAFFVVAIYTIFNRASKMNRDREEREASVDDHPPAGAVPVPAPTSASDAIDAVVDEETRESAG